MILGFHLGFDGYGSGFGAISCSVLARFLCVIVSVLCRSCLIDLVINLIMVFWSDLMISCFLFFVFIKECRYSSEVIYGGTPVKIVVCDSFIWWPMI